MSEQTDLQHIGQPALDTILAGIKNQFSRDQQRQIIAGLMLEAYPEPGEREDYGQRLAESARSEWWTNASVASGDGS